MCIQTILLFNKKTCIFAPSFRCVSNAKMMLINCKVTKTKADSQKIEDQKICDMEKGMYVEVKPVMKVNIPATLSLIPPGKAAQFTCRGFAPVGSVLSAISRLKSKGDIYFVELFDNGESYAVKRK